MNIEELEMLAEQQAVFYTAAELLQKASAIISTAANRLTPVAKPIEPEPETTMGFDRASPDLADAKAYCFSKAAEPTFHSRVKAVAHEIWGQREFLTEREMSFKLQALFNHAKDEAFWEADMRAVRVDGAKTANHEEREARRSAFAESTMRGPLRSAETAKNLNWNFQEHRGGETLRDTERDFHAPPTVENSRCEHYIHLSDPCRTCDFEHARTLIRTQRGEE